jgi:hypothetical protein
LKAQIEQLSCEALKPSSRSLLESINRLLKLADMLRLVGRHITRRLHHVYLFFQNPMKECIPHIKLSKRPVVSHCKSKDKSNSWRFDNWTKSLFKIYHILLVEAFCYQSCLVMRNGTITVSFELENPLASNNVFANG